MADGNPRLGVVSEDGRTVRDPQFDRRQECLDVRDTSGSWGESEQCLEARDTHLRSVELLADEIERLAPILSAMVQLQELDSDTDEVLQGLRCLREVRVLRVSWELIALLVDDAGLEMVDLFAEIDEEIAYSLLLEAVYGETFDPEDEAGDDVVVEIWPR